MIEFKRLSEEVEVEGNKLTLYTRDADDVYALIEYVKTAPIKKMDEAKLLAKSLYINAVMIQDSLIHGFESLSFFKRWKMKRKYSAKSIVRMWTPEMINSLAEFIDVKLEGGEPPDEKKNSKQAKS